MQINSDTNSTVRLPRNRKPWIELWSNETGSDTSMEEYLSTLPSFSRGRNDPACCKFDHVTNATDDNLLIKHNLRRIVTTCRSGRCKASGVVCTCTYRLLLCEQSGIGSIAVDGQHTSKTQMHPRLSPPPKVSQVQAYVKRLRKNNKRDAMKPVLERCASNMYDISENIALAGDRLLILCDVKHENDMLVPNLGTGSSHSPFRIGLTCFTLLDDYVSIQRDPRCTTLFHIVSTHSIVKQRYPVFVFGVSDSCRKFFPLVYFCTSQRTGVDIEWCLSFLKRAIWGIVYGRFAPKFIND
ncbi:Hypothetical protein PHPALM_4125 [Phytophthora palmivora]|uniref:MULE transposase domain-containing protein n=1 Tax=Phytophthora palmivora TaxID=4796 RepID=A0A2P4YKN7_9STRA|nr:Hypothetical protein PHPALM_4125 [Phytophthora palmivora]